MKNVENIETLKYSRNMKNVENIETLKYSRVETWRTWRTLKP